MSWQKVLDCIRVLLPKMSGILHFPIFIISRSISFRSPSSIDRRFWSNRMASTKNSDTAATTKSGDLQEPNQRGHCGRCCCPSSRASCSGRLLLLGGSRSRNNNNKSRCSSVVEQPTATLIAALSILLLSLLADDGVAFRHQPSLPLLGRVARIANYRICEYSCIRQAARFVFFFSRHAYSYLHHCSCHFTHIISIPFYHQHTAHFKSRRPLPLPSVTKTAVTAIYQTRRNENEDSVHPRKSTKLLASNE